MVGLGINGSRGFSVRSSSPVPPPLNPMLTIVFFHQTWSDSTRSSIYTFSFRIYDLSSSVRFGHGNICSVSFFFFFLFFLILMCGTIYWFFLKTCCLHFFFSFLWLELEIFLERKLLDVQVWHRIRLSWWRLRSVASGGTYRIPFSCAARWRCLIINSAMFIGFRHSWAYLFNNDPGPTSFFSLF